MNNELFILAAQFICRIITEWENNGKDLERALQPFLNVHKKHYWDAIDLTINEGVTREGIMEILGESHKYLRHCLAQYLKQADGGHELIDQILSFEFYSLVCGVLENNDQSIDIQSPLQLYLKQLAADREAFSEVDREKAWSMLKPLANRIVAMQREDDDVDGDVDGDEPLEMEIEDGENDEVMMEESEARETSCCCHDHGHDGHHHHHHEDELVDLQSAIDHEPYVFPPCQGLGMFALEATTNHSCVPNCIVKYELDNSMKLIALRDIEPGEELTHSYIEESAPIEQRREELKSYGFVCDCSKCVQEQA